MADTNDRTQNVTLFDNAKNKNVSVVTDGSLERLAVDSNVTADISFTPFKLEVDFGVTPVVLNTSTDTTLFTITPGARGKLDFVAITGTTVSNFEVVIEIDASERVRIAMADLATLGLTTAPNIPLFTVVANKNFRYHPSEGDDFETSFTIKARATTGTPSVVWLTKWRSG